MSYAASGLYAQPYRMKLMLKECNIVETLLDTADAGVIAKRLVVRSGDASEIPPPRMIIDHSQEVEQRLVGTCTFAGDASVQVEIHTLCPNSVGDSEHEDGFNWCVTQAGTLVTQLRALSGTGEPVAGQSHLKIISDMLYGVELIPEDERLDSDTDERQLWRILLMFQIR